MNEWQTNDEAAADTCILGGEVKVVFNFLDSDFPDLSVIFKLSYLFCRLERPI